MLYVYLSIFTSLKIVSDIVTGLFQEVRPICFQDRWLLNYIYLLAGLWTFLPNSNLAFDLYVLVITWLTKE